MGPFQPPMAVCVVVMGNAWKLASGPSPTPRAVEGTPTPSRARRSEDPLVAGPHNQLAIGTRRRPRPGPAPATARPRRPASRGSARPHHHKDCPAAWSSTRSCPWRERGPAPKLIKTSCRCSRYLLVRADYRRAACNFQNRLRGCSRPRPESASRPAGWPLQGGAHLLVLEITGGLGCETYRVDGVGRPKFDFPRPSVLDSTHVLAAVAIS